MYTATAFVLSIIAISMLVWLLIRCQTLLLGFTFLLFISITNVSLSAFLFTTIMGLSDDWITSSFTWVFIYTSLGLIVYVLGAAVAWRPLMKGRSYVAAAPFVLRWVNPRLIVTFIALGCVAYWTLPYFRIVPSGSVVGFAYTWLLPFGVLFALIYSQQTKQFKFLIGALLIYIPVVLLQIVQSGHLGAGGIFLVQFTMVACFGQKLNFKKTVIFFISTIFIASFLFSWLDSRSLIRNDLLVKQNLVARLGEFINKFTYISPASMTNDSIRDYIFKRVDMSRVLAAQAEIQPSYVPYAYGKTLIGVINAVVPRFIWPDKPIWVGGNEFVSRYSGIKFGESTSVALPYQFELYANGGAVCVIIGLFIIGWAVARLELSLYSSKLTLPKFMSLLYLIKVVTTSEQVFTTVVMAGVGGAIAYYLMGRLLAFFLLSKPSSTRRRFPNGPVRLSSNRH